MNSVNKPIHLAGLLCLAFILAVMVVNSTSGNFSIPPAGSVNPSANLSNSTADKLPFFAANYDGVLKGLGITATREFRAVGTTEAEFNFSTRSWMASLNEYSRFAWEGEQIEPIRFVNRQSILGKKKKYSLSFDHTSEKIISTYKNQKTVMINPGQALDKLGFQLQLQYDLLQQKNEVTYHIADRNKIKHYAFEIVGQEIVDTAVGPLQTIKVKVIRENPDRVTWLWMAVDWHNLLTRMEQHEKGKKEFELQLTDAVVGGKTVTGL